MSLIKLNNSHMGGWGSFQKNTVQLHTLPSVNQLHTPAWVRSSNLYMSQRLGWLKAVSGQTCTSIFWLLVSTTARFVWCNPLLRNERPLVPLCNPSTSAVVVHPNTSVIHSDWFDLGFCISKADWLIVQGREWDTLWWNCTMDSTTGGCKQATSYVLKLDTNLGGKQGSRISQNPNVDSGQPNSTAPTPRAMSYRCVVNNSKV